MKLKHTKTAVRAALNGGSFFLTCRPSRCRRGPTSGFSIVEIILGIGMLTTALVAVSAYYIRLLTVSELTTEHIQSGFLLEEGVEVMKLLRDESWSTTIAPLSTTTTYYLSWNGTKWTATTTKQVIENIFTRSLEISDVNRDNVTYNIDPTGTYDPGTKKVTVSIGWQRRGGNVATDTAQTYIMNLFNN
ncbi:MAG: hypothetical protein A2845_00430 [Candidatus Lloydbacteria bacterium RIFCSPHIGHO2_01_FULL_49_22]|uniref:Prepilin-type N-terminal cleavage/methylation domain-containing protein n=1 Tax=Candidatus Lloydbacteria bacterium RIFCSPHIGHO2_01_FULL_49_22 TaxID=1798658 RepID=A0A1G2D0H0_9BACT|nr:MAG: hypothetical protein A2845_00430 [Candidatus Lloydbacteria bacterium RIFCSPHIGHO2_01_FULL_49_22]OGZ09329.1 MAG: hypothetical protein A3C14_05335 [Candidatus Lloydbacteria bacterium RIFCSPHIGHO2_02_FULL_50_18]